MHAIEETGSLRAAAISMNMAYTKALKLIRNAEAALGFSPDSSADRREGWGRKYLDTGRKGVAVPL